jgi:hypothetical protein
MFGKEVEGSGRKMNLAHENCVLRTESGGKEGMDVQSYVLIVKRPIVYKASNMKKKLFEVVMRCESLHARARMQLPLKKVDWGQYM